MILFAWVLLYFGWLGRNWVTSMRYFLPAYPALVVLAAWGLVSLLRYANARIWRRRFAVALLALVGVFSLVWSGMFTNIYRNLLTRVQATYWVWEHVPGDFAMRVVGSGEAAPIINIGLPNNGIGSRQVYDTDNLGSEHPFAAPVTGKIDSLYVDYMDDPQHDAEEENIYFTITRVSDNVQLADALYTGDLTHTDDSTLFDGYLVRFPEFSVEEGVEYQLNVLMISGAPVMIGSFSIPVQPDAPSETPLINIGLTNNNYGGDRDDLVSRVTRFDAGFIDSMTTSFTAPETGTVTSVYAPHLGDPNDDPEPEVLRLTISAEDGTPLATGMLNANLLRDTSNILGASYDIPLDQPLPVTQGKHYNFTVDLVSGGSVISGGSVFTWEGAWDDPVPFTVCALPVGVTVEDKPLPGRYMDARDCPQRIDAWSGLINGYQQDIVYEDEPSKRDRLLMILDNSDYIVITSNRFYDTLSRNPIRWPMTNLYYEKLFAGELGYDVAATFDETFELGPLRVSDQYLPTYSGPKWLNEFESEEAFSVYDHPAVFILQKRADYDAQAVHELLYSVPLMRINETTLNSCPKDYPTTMYPPPCDTTLASVATISSLEAAKMPTDLELTDAMRDQQYENGTRSERFDAISIVNTSQPVGVLVWWMTIMVFGFAAYPLLFVALPSFADRGYGLAKFAGMFLSGWGTWYLASLRIPVWSQVGIGAALLVLFLIGLALLWRRREEFVDYLREHWKRLVIIELITLVAFLVFLGVRLTNPDLWHPTFGGEKPMDFAYFNGVLRSTIFPPLDPWFTGGYINYYYFGFVIVGTPVLLLKMFPSFAYNLILPTLFALTGIAAFSVAFTLVNTLHERRVTQTEQGVLSRARRLGNPWTAGIAALMLAVVLGNLDTTRVFFSGIARAGGYSQPTGLSNYLIEQYTTTNGAAPDDATRAQIFDQASNPSVVDRLSYELNNSIELVSSLGNGLSRLISGQEVYISPERWFWGPTRVLAETPGVEGSAINEMPIFTYIYGDLHAHMIAMPMQLAVVALVLNEILMAGSSRRRRWQLLLGAVLLGMYVGLLRATNTWDWITYMLFGVVGLGFAWWLADSAHFTRRRVIDLAWYVGSFLIASFVAVLPYSMWFATSYTSVRPWTDGKTPVWAYLDIHGLFIFLVVSLLVWDTGRWLRGIYVRALRGTFTLLALGLLLVLGLVLAAVALSAASYQVTLIALPLLVWIAVLFFRAGQSRTMQFVLLVAGLALCLTLGVEYVVLEGDIGRQNTVFKFYIQAWLLLSVVGGTAFAWLIGDAGRWKGTLRGVWTFLAVMLIGIAALFPIMAVRGKAAFRFDIPQPLQEQGMTSIPLTLDGMDFMTYAQQYEGDSDLINSIPGLAPFPLSEDYAMIRWLQSSVRGTPTIIEGMSQDPQYKWDSRISIYTGLPTVLGWNWHQRQQRALEPLGRLVDSRNANVNAFYQTTSIGSAWDIIQYYHVRYVIVGRLEQAYYRPEGLAKFDAMVQEGLLQIAFQAGNSTIYRVNPDATIVEQG
ncbi:MAG: hypothetical protein IT319_09280, partial [Anaerolineae bacterium]|nr:hypothetical protein [Anaerolineae bacterium]